MPHVRRAQDRARASVTDHRVSLAHEAENLIEGEPAMGLLYITGRRRGSVLHNEILHGKLVERAHEAIEWVLSAAYGDKDHSSRPANSMRRRVAASGHWTKNRSTRG